MRLRPCTKQQVRGKNMSKLGGLVVVAAIAIVSVVYYQYTSEDVEPEAMSEDVWWGPESDRNVPEDVRPFQINITGEVSWLNINNE